jgi:hypothetical protein
MLCLHMQASEPLLLGLQVFLSLLALLLYVILWGFGSSEIAIKLRRFVGAAVAATFLSVPLMMAIYGWQNYLTERRADTIIQQVNIYHKQHGHYPESLEKLVPRQLPKVPSTAKGLLQGRPFTYSVSKANDPRGHSFWLGYYLGAMGEAMYSSRSREWHYDD